MVGIPVYCPNCGALFASRAFHIENARNITLIGNRETCVNCGKLANIADGVFDATNSVLTLISGPQFTADLMKAFSVLVEQVARKEITEDQFEEKAAALDPKLGEVVSQVKKSSGWSVPALIFLLFAIKQCNFDISASVDINQLWNQMTQPTVEQSITQSDTDRNR
jgi:hypothetical protein